MNGKVTHTISLALGALSLILVLAIIGMVTSNRHLQETANARAADINKGNSLSQLNQALVQALAEAAVDMHDSAAKDLLAAEGITLKPTDSKGSSDDKTTSSKK